MSKGKLKGKNDACKKSSSPRMEVKLLKIKTLQSVGLFFLQRIVPYE